MRTETPNTPPSLNYRPCNQRRMRLRLRQPRRRREKKRKRWPPKPRKGEVRNVIAIRRTGAEKREYERKAAIAGLRLSAAPAAFRLNPLRTAIPRRNSAPAFP